MENTNRVFEIRTLKSGIIKILIECIKPYIKETNILITSEGLKISTLDSSKCSLTHIKLNADKFEYFYCEKPTIIGVDITALYRLIKSVNIRETICLYQDKDNTDKLGVILEDSFKGKIKKYQLSLLEIEDKIINIPELSFDYIINIPSQDFQQIVRDVDLLESKVIEIKSVGKQLIFSSSDGIAEFETVITEVDESKEHKALLTQNGEDIKSVSFGKSNDSIVQGRFKLYFLMYFIKATHLCQNINIYLKNDKPLVLEYFVADLGKCYFLLSPLVEN
jgi:proliferating cell nuclear antigen